ncbi:MAG TPA: GNAT family N-acetyltransferase [Gammaproteobacteria bacterium]|nr:GNAT family N-acetyltransferase [Gammaproteobacteria bacterium]
MPTNVRLYRSEDFESVWPLFAQVSRFYRDTDVPSAERVRTYVKDEVLGEGSGIRLALAFLDQTPAGLATFAILHPGPGTTGQLYLKELFVRKEHRGKGAGRAIMKFLARYALKEGCSRFDWTGETTNPQGLKFYRALGIAPATEKVCFRLSGKALEQFANS